jgi:hypothetical protein
MQSVIGSIGKDSTLVGLTVIGGNIMFLAFVVGAAWKALSSSTPRIRKSLRNRRLRKFKYVALEYQLAALRRKAGAPSLLVAEEPILSFLFSTIIMFLSTIALAINVTLESDGGSWFTLLFAILWVIVGNIAAAKSANSLGRIFRVLGYAQNPKVFYGKLKAEVRKARKDWFY